MNRVILRRISGGPASPVGGGTGYPAGTPDTSSRLDTGAALLRNTTIPQVIVGHNWDYDRTGEVVPMPEISDQP